MANQRYTVNQVPVNTLLTWINEKEIAIPEIQRPFVWDASKVRDFLDSLYSGYPVGYLIVWRNPTVRQKDGSRSEGKKILIDGQQRVTALLAAVLGEQIVNKRYRKEFIKIGFHPGDKFPGDKRFEVSNPAIKKNPAWISDIALLFAPHFRVLQFLDEYCSHNREADRDTIHSRIDSLKTILYNPIGLIELDAALDVETVSDIFIRVNSQGVQLNAADFVMSKMAANESYKGHLLRKSIDYFCHLCAAPDAYGELAEDRVFANTGYFKAMNWLPKSNVTLYEPRYQDMLRVVYTTEFKRGRLNDLVALLSGRNFETRTCEESIAEDTFVRLNRSILRFMNANDYKQFIMILRSAGFVKKSMIRSMNVTNFAYILFLTLKAENIDNATVASLVRRWFVLSVITSRYTGSPETSFEEDIGKLSEGNAECYLSTVERVVFPDAYWDEALPQLMHTSSATSTHFSVYLASQVKGNDKGFLSKEFSVQTLLEGSSHRHHIFPQNYLKNHGLKPSRYNQIANFVVMQGDVNIAIGDQSPNIYFSALMNQCQGEEEVRYGAIRDFGKLKENLAAHCIPSGMEHATIENYEEFLHERRKLMAHKIRDYYKAL